MTKEAVLPWVYGKIIKLYSPGCKENNKQKKLYSPGCMDNNRQMKLYYPVVIQLLLSYFPYTQGIQHYLYVLAIHTG
jgi:hypothetical protein